LIFNVIMYLHSQLLFSPRWHNMAFNVLMCHQETTHLCLIAYELIKLRCLTDLA